MSQLTPEQIFDALAISVNGPKAWDLDLALDVSFTDLAANYRLTLRNGVLVHRKVSADPTTAGATADAGHQGSATGFGGGRFDVAGAARSAVTLRCCSSWWVCSTRRIPAFNIITP